MRKASIYLIILSCIVCFHAMNASLAQEEDPRAREILRQVDDMWRGT